LLNNAIKFTPKGKITFEVNWHVLSLTNLELQIKISDTGIGISKQKIDGVFDSFNQETINNKRKYGGLGLGLYIVKKIIDESNGKISIESILGEGTVCTVSIPFEKVVLDEPKVETDARNYNLLQKFILVAEDNLLNQLVLKKILKEWQNTEVHFANNGLECLEKLKLKHYDIILMDLQMPEMDGYEATICIRNGEAGDAFKNIPIIAVTADIMESTKKRVFDLGINNYHSKPIEKQLLFEQIYELVKD
jgi:CheY-like chemotaxis protein